MSKVANHWTYRIFSDLLFSIYLRFNIVNWQNNLFSRSLPLHFKLTLHYCHRLAFNCFKFLFNRLDQFLFYTSYFFNFLLNLCRILIFQCLYLILVYLFTFINIFSTCLCQLAKPLYLHLKHLYCLPLLIVAFFNSFL